MANPFSVISPEELTAKQADQLFVEMHSDYPEITRPGNTIIMGARGCGKSMLIRCSLPDFLMVRKKIAFSQLPYLAVCVSIKRTSLNLQELHKLDNVHIPYLINEHFLTLNVVMQSLLSLSKNKYEEDLYDSKAYQTFFEKTYMRYLRAAGCKDTVEPDYTSPSKFFASLYEHLFLMSCEFLPYITNLLFPEKSDFSYSLPLLSYTRFIVPVFTKMLELPGFPSNKTLLIFIDDADNLSMIQTQILNSWLANRTQPTISLKVSTQIGLYKTYLTPTGVLVEAPHDYQEIDISFLYTTKLAGGSFYKKAIKILIKRLYLNGYVDETALVSDQAAENALKSFFPAYEKQENGIAEQASIIRQAYETDGRGYRENDDVRRYAIPNYIRQLGGTSKSRRTYRYAGLENIIHLSSGIIRYLLDAAAKMFDTANNQIPEDEKRARTKVHYIPTEIQDSVMRAKADFYLFAELQKGKELDSGICEIATSTSPQSPTDKLANLINAMGKTFHEILVSGDINNPFSGRSERKVFSIALSNPEQVDMELQQVLQLGVRLGFLHKSYIGNKDGTGRTFLYVLNRCFAPIFTLDPTGFQGYLFMTNDDLRKAIYSGKELRRIDTDKSDDENGLYQLSFFD